MAQHSRAGARHDRPVYRCSACGDLFDLRDDAATPAIPPPPKSARDLAAEARCSKHSAAPMPSTGASSPTPRPTRSRTSSPSSRSDSATKPLPSSADRSSSGRKCGRIDGSGQMWSTFSVADPLQDPGLPVPSAGGTTAGPSGKLICRKQERTKWCWAAATQMLLVHHGLPNKEQCEITSRRLNKPCCETPADCNIPLDFDQVTTLLEEKRHECASRTQPAFRTSTLGRSGSSSSGATRGYFPQRGRWSRSGRVWLERDSARAALDPSR
jgi:hypothetical protein